MRFFFSGELDTLVGDVYRPIRQRVEERLNSFCDGRNYGDAVQEIGIIPIIVRPEWLGDRKERRLFQRRKASADYRTQIDFEKFKSGDDNVRTKLLVKNVVQAILDLIPKAVV
jgi:hypothetical protein